MRIERWRLAIMPVGSPYRWRLIVKMADGTEQIGYGDTPDDASANAVAMQHSLIHFVTDPGDFRAMRWQAASLSQRSRYAAD